MTKPSSRPTYAARWSRWGSISVDAAYLYQENPKGDLSPLQPLFPTMTAA